MRDFCLLILSAIRIESSELNLFYETSLIHFESNLKIGIKLFLL
jgi:hypothetical protein